MYFRKVFTSQQPPYTPAFTFSVQLMIYVTKSKESTGSLIDNSCTYVYVRKTLLTIFKVEVIAYIFSVLFSVSWGRELSPKFEDYQEMSFALTVLEKVFLGLACSSSSDKKKTLCEPMPQGVESLHRLLSFHPMGCSVRTELIWNPWKSTEICQLVL